MSSSKVIHAFYNDDEVVLDAVVFPSKIPVEYHKQLQRPNNT